MWETENGDKRSVVEIVADEIGPSLRFATAQITRNKRPDTDPAPEPLPEPSSEEPAA